MHSFHSGTRPNNYYGTTVLKEGKIFYKNGALTNSLINGNIFIADELNLSSESNIKALSPALEINVNNYIYFPGIENPIAIHPGFLFVAIQNEPGIIGRNYLPHNILKRLKEIFYPQQEVDDIIKICKDIGKDIYNDDFDDDNMINAGRLGEFMIKLNENNYIDIYQWSLRDINKILQRMFKHSKSIENFKNIKIQHEILFYILSSVDKKEIPKIKNKIIDIIDNVFNLSTERNKLSECYESNAQLRKDKNGNWYIFKGECGISIEIDELKNIFNFSEKSGIEESSIYKLSSLLDDLFQISLSTDKEPILIIGPSGYKTFLAQKYLSNSKTITLNQESSIEQLLGTTSFISKSKIKDFYLKLIILICKFNNYLELSNNIKEKKIDKNEFFKLIENAKKEKSIPKSFHFALQNCLDKLFEKEKENEFNPLSSMEVIFKPGLFLNAILGGFNLILKNISNLPALVLERFNELFTGKYDITIKEDITNTITNENKELLDFNE